ncbi:MAG: thiamine biosynthesis protein ThiS [Thermoprotei archaeon]|nr:MAG: thiamine biosynthesis protein ThiS [Thermoprotei archaeon]
MKIKVILRRGGVIELQFKNEKVRAFEILNKLNLQLPAIIILKNGRPIPEDEELRDGDVLRVIDVHSGG